MAAPPGLGRHPLPGAPLAPALKPPGARSRLPGGPRLAPPCCPRRQKPPWGVAANFSLCLIFPRCRGVSVEAGGGERRGFFPCTVWSVAYQSPRGKTFLRSPRDAFGFFFFFKRRRANLENSKLQPLLLLPRPSRPLRCCSPRCSPCPTDCRGRSCPGGSPGLAGDRPSLSPVVPSLLPPPRQPALREDGLSPGSAWHGPGNRFYLNVRCYFYSSWVRPAS